ncbi:LPXTG cell wall anchor domain-containing protein, partial [Pseudokineococcus marinus]|nr:LPXTG cell wall anchor domain-containing protein [Pseudokineococcus marinus]
TLPRTGAPVGAGAALGALLLAAGWCLRRRTTGPGAVRAGAQPLAPDGPSPSRLTPSGPT